MLGRYNLTRPYQLSLEVSRIHSPQNLRTTSSSRQMVNPSHQHPSDTKGLIVGLIKENQWFSYALIIRPYFLGRLEGEVDYSHSFNTCEHQKLWNQQKLCEPSCANVGRCGTSGQQGFQKRCPFYPNDNRGLGSLKEILGSFNRKYLEIEQGSLYDTNRKYAINSWDITQNYHIQCVYIYI